MFTLKNILMLILRNLLVSMASVLIVLAVIVYLSNKMGQIADSVTLNRTLKASFAKRTETAAVLKKDVQTIGTTDAAIENAFVPSENILGFINALDVLAEQQSIVQIYHFETPTPTALSAPFPISTIGYTTNMQTTLARFSEYLKAFQKLPYFTSIESLTIASQDPVGWNAPAAVSFRATLFTRATQ